MDCSPPGSSIHEIFQARILEWTAIFFFRGSSWLRDWTQVFCTVGRFFTNWATREWILFSKCSNISDNFSVSFLDLSSTGVTNLQDLMSDDLRWSWCNNNRNKGHNKCNALESSWNHSPHFIHSSPWKNCLPQNQSLMPKMFGDYSSRAFYLSF